MFPSMSLNGLPDNIKKIRMAYNPSDFTMPPPLAPDRQLATSMYVSQTSLEATEETKIAIKEIREKYSRKTQQ